MPQKEEIISSKTGMSEIGIVPMSEEQLNREIDQSLQDVKEGRITEASTLKDKIKKWH